MPSVELASRLISLANATRVASVVSVYFERFTRYEDGFAVAEALEACWGELQSGADGSARRRRTLDTMIRLEEAATRHDFEGGPGIASAIAAVRAVAEGWQDAQESVERVVSCTSEVARCFDLFGAGATLTGDSCLSFELSCATAVEADVSGRDIDSSMVFDMRLKSGAQSMHYRRALLDWMASS